MSIQPYQTAQDFQMIDGKLINVTGLPKIVKRASPERWLKNDELSDNPKRDNFYKPSYKPTAYKKRKSYQAPESRSPSPRKPYTRRRRSVSSDSRTSHSKKSSSASPSSRSSSYSRASSSSSSNSRSHHRSPKRSHRKAHTPIRRYSKNNSHRNRQKSPRRKTKEVRKKLRRIRSQSSSRQIRKKSIKPLSRSRDQMRKTHRRSPSDSPKRSTKKETRKEQESPEMHIEIEKQETPLKQPTQNENEDSEEKKAEIVATEKKTKEITKKKKKKGLSKQINLKLIVKKMMKLVNLRSTQNTLTPTPTTLPAGTFPSAIPLSTNPSYTIPIRNIPPTPQQYLQKLALKMKKQKKNNIVQQQLQAPQLGIKVAGSSLEINGNHIIGAAQQKSAGANYHQNIQQNLYINQNNNHQIANANNNNLKVAETLESVSSIFEKQLPKVVPTLIRTSMILNHSRRQQQLFMQNPKAAEEIAHGQQNKAQIVATAGIGKVKRIHARSGLMIKMPQVAPPKYSRLNSIRSDYVQQTKPSSSSQSSTSHSSPKEVYSGGASEASDNASQQSIRLHSVPRTNSPQQSSPIECDYSIDIENDENVINHNSNNRQEKPRLNLGIGSLSVKAKPKLALKPSLQIKRKSPEVIDMMPSENSKTIDPAQEQQQQQQVLEEQAIPLNKSGQQIANDEEAIITKPSTEIPTQKPSNMNLNYQSILEKIHAIPTSQLRSGCIQFLQSYTSTQPALTSSNVRLPS